MSSRILYMIVPSVRLFGLVHFCFTVLNCGTSILSLEAENRNFFDIFSWTSPEKKTESKHFIPLSTNPEDIHFYFEPYSSYPKPKEELVYNNDNSLYTILKYLKPTKPFKILIPGFRQPAYARAFPEIVINAYLNRTARLEGDEYNIISVNWKKLSGDFEDTNSIEFDYPTAIQNVETAGIRVGNFISYLMERGIVQNLDNVHLIGFSLGAHVAGIAGTTVRRIYNKKIGRITGLEPSGPGFYPEDLPAELSNEDAAFVDVIHTSQGTYGTWTSTANVEFFPNGGGPIQPYCLNAMEFYKDFIGKCSHEMAAEYYAQSITLSPVKARECPNYIFYKIGYCDKNSTATFGEFVDTRTRGKYFFDLSPGKSFFGFQEGFFN